MVSFRPEFEWEFFNLIRNEPSTFTADEMINFYKKEKSKEDSERMHSLLKEAVFVGNLEIAKKLLEAGAPTVIVSDKIGRWGISPISKISNSFTSNTSKEMLELISGAIIKEIPTIIQDIEIENQEYKKILEEKKAKLTGEKLKQYKSHLFQPLIEEGEETILELNKLSEELFITHNQPINEVQEELKLIEKNQEASYNFKIAVNASDSIKSIDEKQSKNKNKQEKLKEKTDPVNPNMTDRKNNYNLRVLQNKEKQLVSEKEDLKHETENLVDKEEKAKKTNKELENYREQIKIVEITNKDLLEKNKKLSEKLTKNSFKKTESKLKNGICFSKYVDGKRTILTKAEVAKILVETNKEKPEQIKEMLMKNQLFKSDGKEANLYAMEIGKAINDYRQSEKNSININKNKQEKQTWVNKLDEEKSADKKTESKSKHNY